MMITIIHQLALIDVLRPLHESHFTCILHRLKAPTVGKNGLNAVII